jgi:hypothetical protein
MILETILVLSGFWVYNPGVHLARALGEKVPFAGFVALIAFSAVFFNLAGWYLNWPIWVNCLMVLSPLVPFGGPIAVNVYQFGVIWHLIHRIILSFQS